GGGFAAPLGYGLAQHSWRSRSWPQFDWSVVVKWEAGRWLPAAGRSVKPMLRIAIPSRTKRHRQAAVHSIWMDAPENRDCPYGFRLREGRWTCTAPNQSRLGPRGG